MNRCYLGIDTSNYRTSVSLLDESGRVLFQKAVLLEVPDGSRGMRQSEVFYTHSMRLPEYLGQLFSSADAAGICAVGVSERPRRVEGSYMPCFMAGVNAAEITGSALGVPVYRFSHQEGHAAAVLESGGPPPDEFIFFHLSGGTTEALICRPDDNGYDMEIVGGTLDISIGQLIDRFGVAAGMAFPSGQHLDQKAYAFLEARSFDAASVNDRGVMPRLKIRDGRFNLSGAETRLMQYAGGRMQCSADMDEVIAALFVSIAGLLKEEALYLSDKYGIRDVRMAGGVASSRTVRALLSEVTDAEIRFGDPALSGDNAVGTALLAKRIHEKSNRNTGK